MSCSSQIINELSREIHIKETCGFLKPLIYSQMINSLYLFYYDILRFD